MSNEQEMREAIIAADSIRRGEHEGWREFCDRRYEVIWQAATLAAEARIRELEAEVHNLNWALGTEGYGQMATPEEQAEHEEAVSRATANIDLLAKAKARYDALEADARRMAYLRRITPLSEVWYAEDGKYPAVSIPLLRANVEGEGLDEVIDAALTEHKENQG